MDGQVERINLRASVAIKVCVVVGAGLGVGAVIACGPSIGIERGLGDSGMRWIVDRQMQGVHARTTVRIFVFVGICARCGVRFPVPDIAHTGGVVLNLVRAVTNNEMQSDSGVGPVNVLILSGVVSRCGVNDAIPFVGFAGGD